MKKRNYHTVVELKETPKKEQILTRYLLLFFKKFEHTFHVNEGILDHSRKFKMECLLQDLPILAKTKQNYL